MAFGRRVVGNAFDPNEPRDKKGRWTDGRSREPYRLFKSTDEMANWSSRHFKLWKLKLSKEQIIDIHSYCSEFFEDYNLALRKHYEADLRVFKPSIDRIDTALALAIVPENIIVHRLIDKIPPELADNPIGSVIRDDGYGSTSLDFRIGNAAIAKNKENYLKIYVPKGTHAAMVDSISEYKEERELLLPRGTKYQIESREKNRQGGYDVVLRVIAIDPQSLPEPKQTKLTANTRPIKKKKPKRLDKYTWRDGDLKVVKPKPKTTKPSIHARRYEPPIHKFGVEFKKPKPKRNPLRIDPTNTVGIRKAYYTDLMRRLGRARDSVIDELDEAVGWSHKTARQKMAAIRRWLDEAFAKYVNVDDPHTNEPWAGKYVRQAYERGATRAYGDVLASAGKPIYGPVKKEAAGQAEAQKQLFLASLRRRYEETTDLLVDMAGNNVDAITASVKAWIIKDTTAAIRTRAAIPKLKTIIRSIFNKTINNRAAIETNDDVIAAHAEGQLDGFEDMGVDRVGVRAEFGTQQDDRVCPVCKSMEGDTYSIEEARGIIPVHKRCRCYWIAIVYRKRRPALAAAVRTSVKRARRGRVPEPPLRKFGVRFAKDAKSRKS